MYLQHIAEILEQNHNWKITKTSENSIDTQYYGPDLIDSVNKLGQFLTHTVYQRAQHSGRLSVLGQFLRRVIEENAERFVAGTWHDVGTDHEHLHLVHSCQRFNGQCRCYFNRTVSKFGKPEYRTDFRPDNTEGFSNILQYIGNSRENNNFYILRRSGRRSIMHIDNLSNKGNSTGPQEELVDPQIEASTVSDQIDGPDGQEDKGDRATYCFGKKPPGTSNEKWSGHKKRRTYEKLVALVKNNICSPVEKVIYTNCGQQIKAFFVYRNCYWRKYFLK